LYIGTLIKGILVYLYPAGLLVYPTITRGSGMDWVWCG